MTVRDQAPGRPRSFVQVLSLFLLVLPFLLNALRWLGAAWHPTQDLATLEVRVRSVFTWHTPTLGAFSRYGWSHPGPIWYWLIAPLYFLAGRQPWALVTAGDVVSACTLTVGWLYARRLSARLGGALFTATALVPYLWLGPLRIQDPWNPYLAIPFLITMLVGAVGALRHDLCGVAITLVCLSVLLQLHIGYGTCALPVGILCAVYFVAQTPRSRAVWRDLLRGRSLQVALAVVTLMWIPPLLQEFVHYPGNLSRLAAFVVHGDRASGSNKPGIGFALKAMSAGFRVPTSIRGGTNEGITVNYWLLPRGGSSTALFITVLVIVIVAAAVSSRRAALWPLATVAAGFGLSATVNASQVTGQLWSYLFDWRFVAASALWIAVAVVAWTVLSHLAHLTHERGLDTAVALAVVVSAAISGSQLYGLATLGHHVLGGETDGWTLVSHALGDAPRRGYVIARYFGGNNQLGYGDELVDEAQRRGLAVRVDPAVTKFGSLETANPRDATAVWLVSEDSVSTTLLLSLPGARVLSVVDPLTAAQEAQLRTVQLRIALRLGQLNETGAIGALDSEVGWLFLRTVPGVSKSDIVFLSSTARQIAGSGHCRCVIVAMDVTDAPTGVVDAIHRLAVLN